MNIHFQELLPSGFQEDSRVWIYQANRQFGLSEALQIEKMLEEFIAGWHAHGTGVKGYANLFFGRFIVLIADESHYPVSGCSTDSSVRMIKEIEKIFGVDLFDRLLLGFMVKNKVEALPIPQLRYALENGFVNGSTPYFNNTAATLGELRSNWLIPLRDSWLGKDRRFSGLVNGDTTVPS